MEIELLEGTHGDNIDNPLPRTTNNSISATKLLNNSETTKNDLQSSENKDVANAINEKNSVDFREVYELD